MLRSKCWVLQNHNFRPCRHPGREFKTAAVLHSHSSFSEENLGILNEIMDSAALRKLNEFFKRTFSTEPMESLDWSRFHYCSPISPGDVLEVELAASEKLGFEHTLLAVTDHDTIDGCLQLRLMRPDLADRVAISEELSFAFADQVFHLGIIGIPVDRAREHHSRLQALAARRQLGDMFETLQGLGCLVILNHPYYQQSRVQSHEELLVQLLQSYGWGIDALEFNGLRSHAENIRTMELAEWAGKPVVGGGDRHSTFASLVISASREATGYDEFIEEVKAGRSTVVCKPDYFLPLCWKIFVRVLQGVRAYRQITFYNRVPISQHLVDGWIYPDYFAGAAHFLSRIIERLGLAR